METIQEQQKKKVQPEYTEEEQNTINMLKEANPIWYKMLYVDKNKCTVDIDIGSCCLVGEAHGLR